ncbi:MAG: hypothetical protein JW795_08400, partial [Chitinivibrionales bacterium]|nr:hypothetical protein [Chitinivibrionales bacterium]
MVEICKWFGNASVPVVFMIDDFCDTWVDTNKSGTLELGKDWGHFCDEPGSAYDFFKTSILRHCPQF